MTGTVHRETELVRFNAVELWLSSVQTQIYLCIGALFFLPSQNPLNVKCGAALHFCSEKLPQLFL